MAMPAKPDIFDAAHAPVGVQLKFISFWQQRELIDPRILLVHTNAATGEGSIDSASNWADQLGSDHTIPHYQVDRRDRGSGWIARKMLPTDRKGIANQTSPSVIGYSLYGSVQKFSLAIETADLGFPTPGELVGFSDEQAEMVATIIAYEAIVHSIPLVYPAAWYGTGVASHTDPFGYPYWTIAAGKTCPGATKKREMREKVLPRARQILAAWTAPPQPDPQPHGDDMPAALLIAPNDGPAASSNDTFHWDGRTIGWVPNKAAKSTGLAMGYYEASDSSGAPNRNFSVADIQQLIDSQFDGGQLPTNGTWHRP